MRRPRAFASLTNPLRRRTADTALICSRQLLVRRWMMLIVPTEYKTLTEKWGRVGEVQSARRQPHGSKAYCSQPPPRAL